MKPFAVAAAFFAYVCYAGWREQRARRQAFDNLAAYARGQADLCEELYQMKWGKP